MNFFGKIMIHAGVGLLLVGAGYIIGVYISRNRKKPEVIVEEKDNSFDIINSTELCKEAVKEIKENASSNITQRHNEMASIIRDSYSQDDSDKEVVSENAEAFDDMLNKLNEM